MTSSFSTLPSISFEIQKAITSHAVQSLWSSGFCVIDNAFSSSTSAALRTEMRRIFSERPELFIKNHTHLVRTAAAKGPGPFHTDSQLILLEKARIWEADFKNSALRSASPLFTHGIQDDTTLRTMLSLYSPHMSLTSQSVKLQRNAGGCFPMHFDSDPKLDHRKVTAIFYLNDQWKAGDGGELRLYPFPSRRSVDISPMDRRLVLFNSTETLHRVLPSIKERFCFTVWLSGTEQGRSRGGRRARAPQSGGPDRELVDEFLQPDILRHGTCFFLFHMYIDVLELSCFSSGRTVSLETSGIRGCASAAYEFEDDLRMSIYMYSASLPSSIQCQFNSIPFSSAPRTHSRSPYLCGGMGALPPREPPAGRGPRGNAADPQVGLGLSIGGPNRGPGPGSASTLSESPRLNF